MAASIGRRFGGEFGVVHMAVDHAARRAVMRSDVQVAESDPMIFLDQIIGSDTLRGVRARLEARTGYAIDPIIL